MKKFGRKRCREKEERSEISDTFDFLCGKIELKLDRSEMPVGAVVFGVKSFINYLPENISLNLGKTNVDIIGNNLYCSVYSGGSVEISGKITEVKFVKS